VANATPREGACQDQIAEEPRRIANIAYLRAARACRGSVLIWPVAPASSRHWSRQDGGATANLGYYPCRQQLDTNEGGLLVFLHRLACGGRGRWLPAGLSRRRSLP